MSASEAVHMYTLRRHLVCKFHAKQFALFFPKIPPVSPPRLLLVFSLVIRSQLLLVNKFVLVFLEFTKL